MDNIAETVKEFIVSNLLDGKVPDEFTETTSLVSGGILDSIASLSVVGFLEEEYGISVEAHEVNVDNFDTLSAIADLVRSKRTA